MTYVPGGKKDQVPISCERVIKALNFQKPDRIPRYDIFWKEFVEKWKIEKCKSSEDDIIDYYNIDIIISAPDETPWPSNKKILKEENGYKIYRDGWGCVQKDSLTGYFSEELDVALKDKINPDKLKFESPKLNFRYKDSSEIVRKYSKNRAVFGKTGGPYLRTSLLRGTERFLIDIAEDPEYVKELVSKVTDHLISVGIEQLDRDNLFQTGMWIFDDIASNKGLMMSPETYKKIFFQSLVRMVKAYKEAGANKIIMHSDGNIEDVLDMFIEAGIDGINPVEPRAGMNIERLKKKYGKKLSYIGGLCNSVILPRGDKGEVKKHVLSLLELGREGGIIMGAHSIGPDISVETYDWITKVIIEYV